MVDNLHRCIVPLLTLNYTHFKTLLKFFNMASKPKQYKHISYDEFMSSIKLDNNRRYIMHDGQPIYISSKNNMSVATIYKMIVQRQHKPECVCCKATASAVAIIPHNNGSRGISQYHLRIVASNGEYLTLDHIKPQSKGGFDVISNYQLLCFDCNARKGNKTESTNPLITRFFVWRHKTIRKIKDMINWNKLKNKKRYHRKKLFGFVTRYGLYSL